MVTKQTLLSLPGIPYRNHTIMSCPLMQVQIVMNVYVVVVSTLQSRDDDRRQRNRYNEKRRLYSPVFTYNE